MHLSLTDEQEMVQKTIRKFVEKNSFYLKMKYCEMNVKADQVSLQVC
ncbi:hypothetical protein JOC76_002401 [Neobacillus cucumis]|nr:hypothetical protein [Neobacillus cucumis]